MARDGAHLKCLTLASIVALRCQAAPVATSSFRRKFYFTQIRVNLASEKLPKDQSTTRNWSRSRRQSGAKDLPLLLATTTDLCLRSSFIFMCLSVCVCVCAAAARNSINPPQLLRFRFPSLSFCTLCHFYYLLLFIHYLFICCHHKPSI